MEEYKLWLAKARDDLRWTEESLKAEVFYGACFTAHQVAEKALKSFLLFHKKKLRKIHDLLALLEDCITIDEDFEQLREFAEVLFPYYIETRYPIYEELVEFTREQAKEAYQRAEEIVSFVESKLSK